MASPGLGASSCALGADAPGLRGLGQLCHPTRNRNRVTETERYKLQATCYKLQASGQLWPPDATAHTAGGAFAGADVWRAVN